MLRFIDGCNKYRKNISEENVGWVVGCRVGGEVYVKIKEWL